MVDSRFVFFLDSQHQTPIPNLFKPFLTPSEDTSTMTLHRLAANSSNYFCFTKTLLALMAQATLPTTLGLTAINLPSNGRLDALVADCAVCRRQ